MKYTPVLIYIFKTNVAPNTSNQLQKCYRTVLNGTDAEALVGSTVTRTKRFVEYPALNS